VGGGFSICKYAGYATLSGISMATPVVAGMIHAMGGTPLSSGTFYCKGT
jgi:subtilisin family serine protease